MPFGIEVVAIAWVAKSFLMLPVQLLLLRRLLDVPLRSLATPPLAPFVASVVMVLVVAAVKWGLGAAIGDLTLLAIAVPVGALTYLAAIALVAPDLIRTTASAVRLSATASTVAG